LVLHSLGAELHGIALPPATNPNLFDVARINSIVDSTTHDIRDLSGLRELIQRIQPQIIFHLAAQPLVRASYQDPVGTFSTNIMGTVHLLEAARQSLELEAIVVVTSDKCYENREWDWGYRENDPMGGHDPYSSSKGCAELITAAYAKSFFQSPGSARIATARAGNVIGGGDWAADRLIPDVLRAFSAGEELNIRYPDAVRPWQHVLEPLRGYIELAEYLTLQDVGYGGGWNFGPSESDIKPVRFVVEELSKLWGERVQIVIDPANHPHEAGLLKLDCSKAGRHLGWHPCSNLQTALKHTVEWYRAWTSGEDMYRFTKNQINNALLQP
jgi:CDP-glucose 4,6-dehydratase